MLNSPIFQLEYKWLLTLKPTPRVRLFLTAAYVALVLLTAVAAVNLATFPAVPFVRTHEASFIVIPILILQTALNLVLVMQTLSRAMSLVGRERASVQNWEAFILTGIDASTVLVAKWQVVVRSLWRAFAVLGAVRVLVFPIGVMLHYLHSTYGGYSGSDPYTYHHVLPPLMVFVFMVAHNFTLTMLQLPFFAALGVLAASQKSNSRVGIGRGISTWLVIVVGISLFIAILSLFYVLSLFSSMNANGLSSPAPIEPFYSGLHTILLSTLTFADSSLLSPYAVTYFAFYPANFYGQLSVGFVLSAAVMLFWTWAALQLSIWLSSRQGMTRVKG